MTHPTSSLHRRTKRSNGTKTASGPDMHGSSARGKQAGAQYVEMSTLQDISEDEDAAAHLPLLGASRSPQAASHGPMQPPPPAVRVGWAPGVHHTTASILRPWGHASSSEERRRVMHRKASVKVNHVKVAYSACVVRPRPFASLCSAVACAA